MRRDGLTLLALIVALVLLLPIGCQPRPFEGLGQEQAKGPDEAKAALVAVEPEIGQKEAQIVPPAAKPAPKITFDKVVHDFGEVASRNASSTEPNLQMSN